MAHKEQETDTAGQVESEVKSAEAHWGEEQKESWVTMFKKCTNC